MSYRDQGVYSDKLKENIKALSKITDKTRASSNGRNQSSNENYSNLPYQKLSDRFLGNHASGSDKTEEVKEIYSNLPADKDHSYSDNVRRSFLPKYSMLKSKLPKIK